MSTLFLQAFVSSCLQHNFNSWHKVKSCQLAWSKICNRLIFSLTTASKLLSDTIFQIKLPFKTSFEALKFFETPKLQKNDKNVNISSSSDRKRMNNGSLETPQLDAWNGGKFNAVAYILGEVL